MDGQAQSTIDWPEVQEWSSAMPVRPDAQSGPNQTSAIQQSVQSAVRDHLQAMSPISSPAYPSHLPSAAPSSHDWPESPTERFQPVPADASRPYPQQNSIPRSNAVPQPYPEHIPNATMAAGSSPSPLPFTNAGPRQFPADRAPSMASEVNAPLPMPWEMSQPRPFPQDRSEQYSREVPYPSPIEPSMAAQMEFPALRPAEPTPTAMDAFVALLAAQAEVQHHQFPPASANQGYSPFSEG